MLKQFGKNKKYFSDIAQYDIILFQKYTEIAVLLNRGDSITFQIDRKYSLIMCCYNFKHPVANIKPTFP